MIVQADQSIEGWTGGHGPPRALLIISKAKLKLSPRLPARVGVGVWDGGITTSQRAATKAPLRPGDVGERCREVPPCIPCATHWRETNAPLHTFHLTIPPYIPNLPHRGHCPCPVGKWQMGCSSTGLAVRLQFCRHLLTVFGIDPCHFPAGVYVDSL